jgi:hypothetical protein
MKKRRKRSRFIAKPSEVRKTFGSVFRSWKVVRHAWNPNNNESSCGSVTLTLQGFLTAFNEKETMEDRY